MPIEVACGSAVALAAGACVAARRAQGVPRLAA